MPIYEYYCSDCHTIFNFFSRSVNTSKRPSCPKCGKRRLPREVSMFAMGGEHGDEGEEDGMPPIDESRMESALEKMAGKLDNVDEEDPRQAAQLMREFTKATGLRMGDSMQEALSRMEAGEDPEQIENEMGDLIESEEPFLMPEGGGAAASGRHRGGPRRDPNLYDL